MKRVLAAILVVIALAASGVVEGRGTNDGVVAPRSVALNRVALLVFENRSWGQVIGNRSAPYLNSLARHGAVATHYYAIGHPSLPNYLALTTGGHKSINSDCASCRSSGRSLANQLEAGNITWRAYFESIRSRLSTRFVAGAAYDPHYNPFAYTQALRAPDPTADVTSFTALGRDLAARTLPRFAWISPNTRHDGHYVKLRVVDRFARNLVPRIIRALGPRGVLFITWDEGRPSDHRGAHGRGGGRVPLIAVGPAAHAGARVAVPANHYALLRTIEAALHVRPLGHARDARTPLLTGLLRP